MTIDHRKYLAVLSSLHSRKPLCELLTVCREDLIKVLNHLEVMLSSSGFDCHEQIVSISVLKKDTVQNIQSLFRVQFLFWQIALIHKHCISSVISMSIKYWHLYMQCVTKQPAIIVHNCACLQFGRVWGTVKWVTSFRSMHRRTDSRSFEATVVMEFTGTKCIFGKGVGTQSVLIGDHDQQVIELSGYFGECGNCARPEN